MKIITANLNGIRSAHNKGFFDWLLTEDPDIVCLQEIKANFADIPSELINFAGLHSVYYPAQKKGYSGVAILAREKPLNIIEGLANHEIDQEGRYLEFEYQDFNIASIYLPSGSSGEDKQQKKYRFLEYYLPILKAKLIDKPYILCGDWNIAHNEIDLKNWKANQKNSGFLPEERFWLSQVFNLGYLDVWRCLYPEEPGYTWWSNRGQAYLKNVGWRIDYQIISASLKNRLTNGRIYKQQKFSDHAPLIIEYDF